MDSDDRTRRHGWIAAGLTAVALLASTAYVGYLVWVGQLPPEGLSEPPSQMLVESFVTMLFSPLTLGAGIAFALLYYGYVRVQEAQADRMQLEADSFDGE